MSWRLARVAKVYPRRQAADICFCDDDSRAMSVPIMSRDGSSDSGSWRVPSVPRPKTELDAAGLEPGKRVLLAVVAISGGRPIILGFVRHQDWSWQPTEDDRWFDRHPSGAYVTVGPDGSWEVCHPSGAHLRIGAGPHADVPGAPPSPGGADPTITLATAHFVLTVAPDGAVSMTSSGAVAITSPTLTHNGKNVGGTHTHTAPGGGGTTSAPN